MRCGGAHSEAAPWYKAHPCAASVLSVLLFVGAVVVQIIDVRQSDAVALLSVLPIALVAVTFGLTGGLSAATAGYAIFAAFTLTDSSGHLGVDGWLTRAAVMFLLGGLLGRASDQSEQATRSALESQRERLIVEEQNRRYGEGLEISDSILQHLAAAKWMLERDDTERAATLLATALERGQHMVGELLPEVIKPPEPAPVVDGHAHPQPPRVRAGRNRLVSPLRSTPAEARPATD